MTEDEKRKLREAFRPPDTKQDEEDTYWTEERLIETAKKIKERIGLDETFYKGDRDRSPHGNR